MSAIDRGGVRGITIFLEDLVRRSRTPGLQYLVVDRAATRFEYCGGTADLATGAPMLAATTMMAYSMSKTITAAAVLQLVDTKTIGLDDPMSRYVATPYGDAITIRQLLAHTSGIPNPIPLRWVHPVSNHATFDEVAALDRVMRKHPRLAFSPARFGMANASPAESVVRSRRRRSTRDPSPRRHRRVTRSPGVHANRFKATRARATSASS